MKKIVLLDLDGTIGDTKFGVLSTVKYALQSIGHRELTQNELNQFIGPPIFEALIDAGVPESKTAEAIDNYRFSYSQPAIEVDEDNAKWVSPMLSYNIGDKAPGMHFALPFVGIEAAMEDLAKHNDWVIITGTSKPELWAREIIKNFGIAQCFTPVKHNNELQSGKPEDVSSDLSHTYLDYDGAGELKQVVRSETDGVFGASMDKSRTSKRAVLEYALAAAGYDASVDKAILIGDRKHDIEGAHQIGIDVVGCSWGYADPGELEPADFIISDPAQLESLLIDYFA